MELAGEKDIQAIYNLVKAAYNIEMGDNGVSFKNSDRYISPQSVLKDLPFIWVLRENEEMIGCIKGVVSHNGQIVEIGPVAVRPDKQEKGYGRTMIEFVEKLAPIQQVGVVSCRTDVMPMYKGRGYHAVREDPIVDHIPRETLTRTELKYVIMIRNKRNLPLPNEILRSKSGSGVQT